jgi:cellobiose phosphorylase
MLSREVARTVFNENAIIGDLLRVDLPGDAYLRTDYVFSIPENKEVLDLELSRPLGPADTDQAIVRLRQRLQHNGNLSMTFGEGSWNGLDSRTFNYFLPFLKKQVALCANIKGYLQRSSNSLVGFRDVFQAIDGHLFDQPIETRAKILEALGMVLVDGRCPRQYMLPANGYPGRMDLRQFIDQGVWAISTVYNYVAVTGDISILSELVGYQQLSDEDGKSCKAAIERDSALAHLLRIMCYLDQQRDSETGLILSLYGDWNDALDGLGVSDDPQQPFGTGVSVMTSLQVLQNCGEICDLLTRFAPGQHADEVDRYTKLRKQLRDGLLKFAVISQDGARRILHGWGDRRRYFVGSFHDCDGFARDGLTSNAFWVLSDMLDADDTLKPHILAALHRLDSPLGFKTFSPGFAPDASGVGRINRLPLGAAENGAAYLHATTFAIAALFRMGEVKHAWQQIAKIMPFAPHHQDASHSPFVMPNSYVFNPQLNLTGQSMNDWQTGCSNVLLKLLVRHVFGFRPGLDELIISPADWLPFDGFIFQGTAHGKQIQITLRYADVLSRRFTLNGVKLSNTTYDDSTQTIAAHVDYAALERDSINHIVVIDARPHG